LPDTCFESPHGIAQRFLPDIMLMVEVPIAAYDKDESDHRRSAPFDHLIAVLGGVLDTLADLVYKLVVLELSTMCSIHK
jgi:hypothetical protein